VPQEFDREVLARLPLAEGVLTLWRWICDDDQLDDLYDRHRGSCYTKKISFSLLAHLIRDALLEPDNSAHKSFRHAQQHSTLPTVLSCPYDKLGRLPFALSEAFLAEGADRLRLVLPPLDSATSDDPVPASLRLLEVIVLDGKAVKRVPKRLLPARQHKGGLLGGKGLAALHLRSGLVLALATDPDGEANDAKLVPAVLPQVRSRLGGTRLWLADRQFCDLNQAEAFTADGDHFLVRYHPKTHFCPDPERPAQTGQDSQGRTYRQEWGWLGTATNKRRRYVRRITLYRPGEEDVVLVSDLTDADVYPAEELLALYLARWGVERVFQQITEVFHLNRLIATTPEGTLFQLAFCLLLYNVIQLVRGYVAAGQQRALQTISTELLFGDVTRQLVALHELVEPERLVELIQAERTAEEVRRRLQTLLGGQWSECWKKAPPKKRQPPVPKKGKRDHTSVYRLLNPKTTKKTKAATTQ
jgi:hypothetical protein